MASKLKYGYIISFDGNYGAGVIASKEVSKPLTIRQEREYFNKVLGKYGWVGSLMYVGYLSQGRGTEVYEDSVCN